MALIRKKGDPTDPILILVILVFLAISMVIGVFVNTKIGDIISTTQLNQTTAYASINAGLNNVNMYGVQQGFLMMFALICIFLMVSSFLVKVHPVFLFLYIIMLGITVFVSIYVGNFYYKVQTTPGLQEVFSTQPQINFILNNIVLIMLGLGALSMLIVFVKLFQAPVGGGGDLG
jgi:hypothetical protein